MTKVGTVLYVDDEPLNLMVFEAVFKNTYTVVSALSGEAALEQLRATAGIDVVIADLSMPRINGLELIALVKKEFPTMPCYLLTGYDLTDVIEKSIESGHVRKCFGKPIQHDLIDKELRQVLNKVQP